jgi:hypothetical protein
MRDLSDYSYRWIEEIPEFEGWFWYYGCINRRYVHRYYAIEITHENSRFIYWTEGKRLIPHDFRKGVWCKTVMPPMPPKIDC